MNKVYLFLLFLLLFLNPFVSTGQRLSGIDTNKYRIDLPDYWKAGSRVWRILSDKLPLVCPELKDKDLCGDDCNPKYSIELYLSDPEIVDFSSSHLSSDKNLQTWQHTTYFAFECNLVLFDENHKPITRFIIVDLDEVWPLTNKTSSPNYSSLTPPMKLVVSANPRANILEPPRQTPTPRSVFQEPRRFYLPQEKDLLSIVDNKFKSWK
jgi:hypothetical protein